MAAMTILWVIAGLLAAGLVVALAGKAWTHRLHALAALAAGGFAFTAGLGPVESALAGAAVLAVALAMQPPKAVLIGAVVVGAAATLALVTLRAWPRRAAGTPAAPDAGPPPERAPPPEGALPAGITVREAPPAPAECVQPLAGPRQMLAVLNPGAPRRKLVPFAQRRLLARKLRALARGYLPEVRIITEENIEVLMAAQGKELAACEGACEIETGRRLGADVIVSGEISRQRAGLLLFLSAHRPRDASFVDSASITGADAEGLSEALEKSAARFFCGPRALVRRAGKR